MPVLPVILFSLSALALAGSLVSLVLRRLVLALALFGAAIASVGLCVWAATRSDPPSLLPLWGWLAGAAIGALAGLVLSLACLRARSTDEQMQQKKPKDGEGK